MSPPKPANPFLAIAKRAGMRPFDVEELVLDRAQLTDIPDDFLSPFPNLKWLYIPFNRITKLHHLERNTHLKVIDARSNELTDLDLPRQQFLEELLLGDNHFPDLDVFLSKTSHMHDLTVLDLQGNPLCQEKGYRKRMIAKFGYLRVLDGIDVTAAERAPPPRLIGLGVLTRPRAKSMVDYLRTRPLSEADSVVEHKAMWIRKGQEERKKREMEEATAIARARTEAFEAGAKQKTLPLAEALQRQALETAGERPRDEQKRGSTRLWVKAAQYRDLEDTPPEQAVILQMNPKLTEKALKRAVDFAIVYPTFA
jgi:hypothetical protein